MLSALPASGYLSTEGVPPAGRSEADVKAWREQVRAYLASRTGAEVIAIASAAITPTRYMIGLSSESAGNPDTLETINTTNYAPGATLLVFAVDGDNEPITLDPAGNIFTDSPIIISTANGIAAVELILVPDGSGWGIGRISTDAVVRPHGAELFASGAGNYPFVVPPGVIRLEVLAVMGAPGGGGASDGAVAGSNGGDGNQTRVERSSTVLVSAGPGVLGYGGGASTGAAGAPGAPTGITISGNPFSTLPGSQPWGAVGPLAGTRGGHGGGGTHNGGGGGITWAHDFIDVVPGETLDTILGAGGAGGAGGGTGDDGEDGTDGQVLYRW